MPLAHVYCHDYNVLVCVCVQMQYSKTSTYKICTKLDFPPVSSAIIWARQVRCSTDGIALSLEAPLYLPHLTHTPTPHTQIDRQLQTYLQRVEAVLGAGWEKHVEGQRLKEDGDSFRQKLNTQPLFDDWRKKVCGCV